MNYLARLLILAFGSCCACVATTADEADISTPEPLPPWPSTVVPVADATQSAPAPATPLPACDSALTIVDATDAYDGRRKLRGETLAIRGTLHVFRGGCTEAGCGNTCRFSVVLTEPGRPMPPPASTKARRYFELRQGTEPYDHRFECTASAGDPCGGTEPPGATEPACAADLPTGEVVVQGSLATPDELGAQCDPPCRDPFILSHATLCEPPA